MVIKKQAVISWLLDNTFRDIAKLGVPATPNQNHYVYLSNGLNHLAEIRKSEPEWGLPELLMPSFENVMHKSAKGFFNVDHDLFKEFYKDNECGILLSRDIGTIVYGFGEDKLFVWVFSDNDGASSLYLYFCVESLPNNHRQLYTLPTLDKDPYLFNSPITEGPSIYERLANKIIIYLAVKKFVKVETVVIPNNAITILDDSITPHKESKKIKNICGQEVIVMDSRYFRKIVNDNDIFVRGFFRLQRYKEEKGGEWMKKLIFVEPHIRHGYHRNALIEDEEISEVAED